MRVRTLLLVATIGGFSLARLSSAQSPSPSPSPSPSVSPTPSGSSDEIVFTANDAEDLAIEASDTLILIQGGPVAWIQTDKCSTAGNYPFHPAIAMRDGKQTATLVIVCKAVAPGYTASASGTPVPNGTDGSYTTFAAPEATASPEPTPM